MKSKHRATLEDSYTKAQIVILAPDWTTMSCFCFWAHDFPIKIPYLLFDHLLTVYTNRSQIITFKGSFCIIPSKDFWFLMLRAANEERCVWLSSAKRVPASVVFWTLSSQLLQASACASKFLHSAAGTKDFKRFTEVPHPGITTKNMKWSGERKVHEEGWARKGVQEADPK